MTKSIDRSLTPRRVARRRECHRGARRDRSSTAGPGPGREVAAIEADPLHRPIRAGRFERGRRALRGHRDHQAVGRPERLRREQARRCRGDSDAGRGQGGARWPHLGARPRRHAGGQPVHAVEPALRRQSRLHADHDAREGAERPGRPPGRPGAYVQGVRRAGQGRSDEAQLFVGRQRQRGAPEHGVPEARPPASP